MHWSGATRSILGSVDNVTLSIEVLVPFWVFPASYGIFDSLHCMEMLALIWPENINFISDFKSRYQQDHDEKTRRLLVDCTPAHEQPLCTLHVLIIRACPDMRGIIPGKLPKLQELVNHAA